jgi:acyl-CoA synthetase (NDP forming)
MPGGGWLPPLAVSELLACYGLPFVATKRVTSAGQAVAQAAELGGPVVLKADVTGVLHKTDAGAVALDLRGDAEVRAAYASFEKDFGERLTAVLVQPMVSGGAEVIVGVVQDPVFGPLVVFGLGGVATEVLGDHAARLAPLTNEDAGDMIHSVRAAPLLLGHRGSEAVDTAALADTLLRVSELTCDLPEVAELDLNPVIARPDGVFAVDARVRITCRESADPFLRQLRQLVDETSAQA